MLDHNLTRPRLVNLGLLSLCSTLVAASCAFSQPTNTSLPANGMWMSMGTMTYDTGMLFTESGGIPGQMMGPYFDTSYGIMNEPASAWFTGNDASAQQFIQDQVFGNLGAGPPSPSPWGFGSPPASGDPNWRFYNFGYGGTNAGDNFPNSGSETRTIEVPHWVNPNPDAGGVAVDCQEIFVPVSAKISVDLGWGGDEMYLDIIGGNSGQESKFTASADVDASYSVNGAGAYTGTASGELLYTASMQNFDAGSGNAYQATQWGLNAMPNPGQGVGFDTSGSRTWEGTTLGTPTAGIPDNSIGTSISEITGMLGMINIAGVDVVETGGTFEIAFDSTATLTSFVRDFGNADGRISFGPGMLGEVQYTVTFEKWKAIIIPEPQYSIAAILVTALWFARRRTSRRLPRM